MGFIDEQNKKLNKYDNEAKIYFNPLDSFPRNSPCPCNSGKKFKKCHRGNIEKRVNRDQFMALSLIVRAAKKGEEVSI